MQIVIAYVTNLKSVGVFLPIFHISKSYIFMQKEVCCDSLSFFANPDDEEQGFF